MGLLLLIPAALLGVVGGLGLGRLLIYGYDTITDMAVGRRHYKRLKAIQQANERADHLQWGRLLTHKSEK